LKKLPENKFPISSSDSISQEHENLLKTKLETCRKGKSIVKEMIQKKEFKNPESLQVKLLFKY